MEIAQKDQDLARAPSMHPVTLRFGDRQLERRYHEARLPYRILANRISALAGSLAYLAFLTLDRFTIQDPSAALFTVSLAGIIGFALIFLATILVRPGRWIEPMGLVVIAGNALFLALYLMSLSATSHAYDPPSAVYTMAAVTCFALCGVTFIEGALLALYTIGIFLLVVTVLLPEPPLVIEYQWAWMALVVAFSAIGSYLLDRTQRISWLQRLDLAEARTQITILLHNVLPPSIAARKLNGENPIADDFPEASLLFADVVDFTRLSSRLSSTQVVSMLGALFGRFDQIAQRYGLEKIKTIGDCYMLAGGIPFSDPAHLDKLAAAALDMLAATRSVTTPDGAALTVRIGMNAGPVTAGVIGESKFIFDVWGDTVNVASRMESQGVEGQIRVTKFVRDALARAYDFEGPFRVDLKGKGQLDVWRLVAARTVGEAGWEATRGNLA
ncbi:adenylate/guanylate cyclase domain-containing protein [Methylocapsa sp. S129]|uniref:adenylate/guanylate cyclase domain-containing protein n=1 Tax=Methylocapsa sp. S129 TaxID=1641869 RepID=UPI00131C492B|nr:adenylate/guanylate cyclase domain-containing protein [Methylocapsa sp. S129]